MNSTLDDLENGEDLNELESRLYAQIHHEAPANDILTPQPLESEILPVVVQRVVTNTSVINNVNVAESKLSNRYWFNSQNTQQVVQRKKWQDNPKTDTEVTNNKEIMKLKEKTFKPFMAYEPIISSLVDKTDDNQPVIPQNELSVYQKNQKQVAKNKNDNTSNIGQEDRTETSVSKINPANVSKRNQLKLKKQRQREKNLQNQRKHVTGNQNVKLRPPVNEMDTQMQKKLKYNKKTGVGLEKDEPLVRNFLKMQRALKLQAKKMKGKAARQKNVQKPPEKTDPISFDLTTDDEANDDVIIIPVPPPPIVTINDTSSEDGEETVNNETKSKRDISKTSTEASFAKPKNLKISSKTVPNINDNNSSRCASPCSVISTDDFIAQADRSRLLHDRIIVNDDDLICIQDNVENYIENPQESDSRVSDDNCHFTTQVSNRSNSLKSNEYHETQDVYCESESDIQESIYSKNSKIQPHTQTTKTNVIIEESSSETNSDCCVEIDNTLKIKRLRKRRASSSNKETELSNNDSTDSNGEETTIINERNTSITTLPFITRGEAVEKCKVKSLKKKQRTSQSSRVDVNLSDNEFINMLQTFSQGGKSNNSKIISLSQYSDESTKSEEDLTARTIAEEILNKFDKKSKRSNEKNNVENVLLQNTETIEDQQSDKDSDRGVPILDTELMERQFDIIDNMSKVNSNNNKIDSDLTHITTTTETEQNISNSSKVYNIIHTNSNNIGWNEEMYRFYNCSWGGENFNVNQIRKKMDRKARWTVHTEDRFPKYKKYSNIRCNNCYEMGHIQAKCPQPKKPLMCSMCGEIGHREPRCPNTICLRCGKKTRVFVKRCNGCATQNRLICPICKIRGHGIDFCPDKWRRYHSTVLNNAQPNSTIIYSSKKFCCICAGRGHLSENCKVAYRFSEYPPTLTEIKSHRKSYDDQKKVVTLLQNVNSYNLLYEPDDTINFSFSTNSNITTKQYYGRYLDAVGLNHIIKSASSNKRKLTIPSDNDLLINSQEKVRKTISRNNNRKSPDTTNKNVKSQSKNLVRNPFSIERKRLLSTTEVNNMEEGDSMEMSDNIIIDASEKCIEQLDTTNKSTEIEELNNNNSVLPEHHFKSPNILVEKSSISPEQTDMNKSEDITQNSALKETLNLDSDSNYSFSEHFDVNIVTSTPAKISRSRPMEELPDFIPLNSNDDNVVNDDNFNVNDDNIEISTNLNPNSDDDAADFENTFKLPDIPCVAKIYLKKDFSDYLLSPEGNKFLVDNSNKFDVKASIDWTRVGNILVLEGLRDNQDKFHTQLLLAFRTLPDKLNRKELENAQQVPRKRIKMIRFLSENLRLLQKSNFLSADVNLLYKQLQDYENKNSQTSWKMAEKTRRTLNMILFGKVGLRDGKENLDFLVNSLKSLALLSEEDLISNEIRESISKSWKYIFSSQKHDNYKELVEIFYDMKRKNLFPKLKINERLWSRNILNLSLTQNEKNEILSNSSNYYNSSITNLKQSEQYNNSSSFNDSSSATTTSNTIPKLILDTSEPIISKDLTNISLNITTNIKNNSINQSFSEFLNENVKKENCQLGWENECIKLLTQIENCTKNSSKYWSKQSVKIINSCIIFYKSHQLLCIILQKILQKANKSLLSYDDHRDILKIYNNLKISENS